MMSLYSFLSAIELGLIYSLMVLGLFLSYRVLNIPDLTVDGSFTLGAAVAVVMTLSGHPILGLFAAILAGAAAGFLTAFLQTKMKIQPILAGIITMTALYSINLMVMDDKANVPITQQEHLYRVWLVGRQAGTGNGSFPAGTDFSRCSDGFVFKDTIWPFGAGDRRQRIDGALLLHQRRPDQDSRTDGSQRLCCSFGSDDRALQLLC